MEQPSPEPQPATGPDPEAEPTATGSASSAATVRRDVARPNAGMSGVPPWAWVVLALFFAMQRWTMADVWLMASVLPRVKAELASWRRPRPDGCATVLLIGAAVAGPTAGYFIDRMRRPRLLAIGFAVWSLAVVATGLTRSYRPDPGRAGRSRGPAGRPRP